MVKALVLMNKPQISTSSDGIPSMKPPIKCLPERRFIEKIPTTG
jgi:hypothetical protein